MNRDKTIENEVEKTLGVLSRSVRVRATPFTSDKVMRRISDAHSVSSGAMSRGYRLVFAALFVLIVVNVFSLIEVQTRVQSGEARNPVFGLASEYRLIVSGYQY